MPAKPKGESKTKPLVGAAVCEGGPRDGWWYYVTDLEHFVRIGERLGRPFPYEPTIRFADHKDGRSSGVVWTYTGP